jgi:hypothetical protein
VKVLEASKSQVSIYHPFTILDGETPQKIAYDYYGSTEYTWVIFLVNNIIDPYYEWPLNTTEFEDHMKLKYGSLSVAQSTILHYKKTPKKYYLSLTNPSAYIPFETFSGDASQYQLVDQDGAEIRMSVESYNRNADADFAPVYAYDWEHEQNEIRRNIKLLDRSYIRFIEKDLKNLMST